MNYKCCTKHTTDYFFLIYLLRTKYLSIMKDVKRKRMRVVVYRYYDPVKQKFHRRSMRYCSVSESYYLARCLAKYYGWLLLGYEFVEL